MTTQYPGALDTTSQLKDDAADPTISSITHPTSHNNQSDALIAIETELGTNPSSSYGDVAARLADNVFKTPTADQIVISQGATVVPLILKLGTGQATARLIEVAASNGSTLGYWNRTGILNGSSLKLNNVALASTDLSDTANILRNPSPSITNPSMSSPTLTGTPTAPTAAVDTNTTQIATTAFVKNQGYIPLDSPTFTGTPTAPTPSVGDSSTKIATTAFVLAEITNRASPTAPVGTISAYGNSTPPSGWLVCDGSSVLRATYPDLFTAIGTTYGSADGTHFNLPDMRGRIPWGKGTHVDVDALGDSDGVAVASRRPAHAHSISLSTSGDGSHSHSISGTSSAGSHGHTGTAIASSTTTASGGTSAGVPASVGTSSDGGHSHSMSTSGGGSHTHSVSGSVGVAGPTDQPAYAVAQYIIRYQT